MWNLQHFNAFGVFLCRSNFLLHLFPTEGHSEPSRIAFDGIHGKIPRDFLEVPLSLPPPEGEPVVLVDRGTIVSVLKEGLLGMHICFWPFFSGKKLGILWRRMGFLIVLVQTSFFLVGNY